MSSRDVIDEKRKNFFPLALSGSMSIHAVTFDEISGVMGEIFAAVFGQTDASMGCFQTPPARKFTEEGLYRLYLASVHHEFFVARDETGKSLGWFIGEAEDYATFYLRNGGVVPDVRGQGILRSFLPNLLTYLRAIGYERVTSQHHPNNTAVCIAMLKNGFVIEGMSLDERAGPLIKMIRYLHEDRRRGYESTFRLPTYGQASTEPSKQ